METRLRLVPAVCVRDPRLRRRVTGSLTGTSEEVSLGELYEIHCLSRKKEGVGDRLREGKVVTCPFTESGVPGEESECVGVGTKPFSHQK